MPAAERQGVDDEVLAAYERALDLLGRSGAEIVDVELPLRFTACFAAHDTTVRAEAYSVYGKLVDDDTTLLDASVRRGIRAGRDISASDYLSATRERDVMQRAMCLAMVGVDALLTPTTETPAVRLEEVDDDRTASRFTRFVNAFGMCALAIPCGVTSTGLPLSMQIVCRGFEESMALRIGHAFQQMTEHHLLIPELRSA
jgi:aspartyl-tRNA(Asn)/glutamyl-tRNA(Gln) amidotransferase subunit A